MGFRGITWDLMGGQTNSSEHRTNQKQR
jgi:hypothetical protein